MNKGIIGSSLTFGRHSVERIQRGYVAYLPQNLLIVTFVPILPYFVETLLKGSSVRSASCLARCHSGLDLSVDSAEVFPLAIRGKYWLLDKYGITSHLDIGLLPRLSHRGGSKIRCCELVGSMPRTESAARSDRRKSATKKQYMNLPVFDGESVVPMRATPHSWKPGT